MKRRITISVALALGILLCVVASASTASAQLPADFRTDTGIVKLGPNQMLRVRVAAGDLNADETVTVSFNRMNYTQGPCSGGVCRLVSAGTVTAGPYTLASNEAVALELVATTYGRSVVMSSSRNARVTMEIIDRTTGQIIAILIGLLVP